ncbi:MAG: VWA domain-containing protein [Spirochaetes bacterium]|nr:VWA domain-containing protein [Spirochaetota bacterium]
MNKNRLTTLIILFSVFSVTTCNIGSGGGTSFNPNIYLDKSGIEFSGTVLDNYIDRTINIGNNGNEDLTIGEITASDEPFSISSDTCSGETLSPLETCSIKARFFPTDQGPFTGTLSIPSNDPDAGTTTVPLSGEGYGLNVWISNIDTSECPPHINIDVCVTDSSGAIPSLGNSNLKLNINDNPKDAFTLIPPVDLSVSIVLAIDLSGSLTSELTAVKNAASYFIGELDSSDEAAICKFNADISIFPETLPLLKSTDGAGQSALQTYLDQSFTGIGGTALYNAVFDSIDRAKEGSKTTKAVLAISDGSNNSGDKTLSDVISYSQTEDIPIFSIYYVDIDYYEAAKPEIMQQIASDTGGQYYNSGESSELENIYGQISSILRKKYTIRYNSTSCTGTFDVKVRVEDGGLYGIDSKTIELE